MHLRHAGHAGNKLAVHLGRGAPGGLAGIVALERSATSLYFEAGFSDAHVVRIEAALVST